jgi:hypothetical protein
MIELTGALMRQTVGTIADKIMGLERNKLCQSTQRFSQPTD